MALAIVPARGGSKSIPRKNMVEIAGKPLIDWTLEAAGAAHSIDSILVSSDNKEILEHSATFPKVRAEKRPAYLAEDHTSTEAVIDHIVETSQFPEDRIFVLLQPTSPVRTPHQINDAVELCKEQGASSVVSVVPAHDLYWIKGGERHLSPSFNPASRPRRQDLLGTQFVETGSIYVFTLKHWNQTKCRLGGDRMVLMGFPEETRYQIDSPLDLFLVESILKNYENIRGMV
jgi:CMP-N,N'-diacetyllegionaminic acid synthase